MNEKQINELLKIVRIDRDRVKESIFNILSIYNLKLENISVSRKRLDPSQIFVAAVEECNLGDAKRIMEEKYSNILPAPITVIEYKGKYFLFQGSNRSIVFTLKGEKPDCILVKVPNTVKMSMFISEAKQTLEEIIANQK